MAEFPKLKSGAEAQYPLRYEARYETNVTRFVDGAEQRFRQHGAPMMTWEMRLSMLDESEARVHRLFFEEQAGRAGEFPFPDPGTGQIEEGCHFVADACEITQTDENKHALNVGVQSKV